MGSTPSPQAAVVTSIIFMVLVTGLQAQTQIHIQDYVADSEFKACGLHKLTEAELVRLDAWLTSYTLTVIRYSTQQTSSSTSGVVESRIDGTFEGWDGETIFKLENGQIWQQSSYSYIYHYAYRPKVLIYKDNGSYKMEVEGVSKAIRVKRIK